MAFQLECPIDFRKVDEHKVRLTALWVLLITEIYFITGYWFVTLLLSIDFALRAFDFGKYSILNKISEYVANKLNFQTKPIELAPKLFAAKIGLAFTVAITILALFDLTYISNILAGVLILFALLESALGFCAGCYAYTFYKKILGT